MAPSRLTRGSLRFGRIAATTGAALVLYLAFATACTTNAKNEDGPPATSSAIPASPASIRRPRHEPLLDERVDIPGGAFKAGSLPGDVGRVPGLEPRLYEVELGPFQIDKLPYPNDPGKPPLVGVTREDAKRLCAERGARLCTELEWERACKGPGVDTYSTGAEHNRECEKNVRACASGFDVLGMGAVIREWTASDVVPAESELPRRAAVRGAAADAPAEEHRCARRLGVDPKTTANDLGFRCCRGAPNAATVDEPRLGAIFEKTKLSAERLAQLLRENDRTRQIAKDVKFFREPDSAKTVLDRGPGDTKGFKFTVAPLLWSPAAGARFLLVVGRSEEKTSFVLAYHVLGDDRFRLASSYVMRNEPGPVALAYGIRERVHFSTCWGCPGETGKILFREAESAVIVQP